MADLEAAFDEWWADASSLFDNTAYTLNDVLMTTTGSGSWSVVPPPDPYTRTVKMVLEYKSKGPIGHEEYMDAGSDVESTVINVVYCGCASTITVSSTSLEYNIATPGAFRGKKGTACTNEYTQPKNFVPPSLPTPPGQPAQQSGKKGKKGKKGGAVSSTFGKKGKKGGAATTQLQSKKGKKGVGKMTSGASGGGSQAGTSAVITLSVVAVVGAALAMVIRRHTKISGYTQVEFSELDEVLNEETALLA